MKLAEIQQEIKAPKGQFNSFGKYKYRSCEDLVEAIKPVINPKGYSLILTDEVLEVGGRVYFKATATITNGTEAYSANGWAREDDNKKGMDASQLSGATSSYARKYALNGLFAIDDTKDSDTTNDGKEEKKVTVTVEKKEPQKLINKVAFNPENKRWLEAKGKLSTGETTIEKLKEIFIISEENIKLLLAK